MIKLSEDGKKILSCSKDYTGTYIIPNGVVEIGLNAFKDCQRLTGIEMPSSVVSICAGAFDGCTALKNVVLPSSVQTIGDFAFSHCINLKTIEITSSIKNLGGFIFCGCNSLDRVIINDNRLLFFPHNYVGVYKIPDGIETIKAGAFSGCINLNEISLPDSLISIEDMAFSGTGLAVIKIPNNTKHIGYRAFGECKLLRKALINAGVTCISRYMFHGCKSLQYVSIPETVKTIMACSFAGCSSLESLSVPNSVSRIEYDAFAGCDKLKDFEIPNSVTFIGARVFSRCSKLKNIYIPMSVRMLENSTFQDIPSLVPVFVDSRNPYFYDVDGCLFSKDKSELLRYSDQLDGFFAIPEGITTICSSAFSNCEVKYVKIPSSISKICDCAFDKVKIQELHIRVDDPNSIEISTNAFGEISKDCILYVPIGTGYAYRNHPVFGCFKEVIIEK